MTGLVLKLAPNERVLINGAVIENGARRGRLHIVTPDAHVLRLRDAIHPDQASTPVSRLCYTAQLVLSGDVTLAAVRPDLMRGIEQLSHVLRDAGSTARLDAATIALRDGQVYQALRALRDLLPREARLLAAAAAS
ncbi:FlbT [Oceaniovalibus guishaninsula JLT2003]|uniref:FlbT n=1 Tax=Oceaniovalibus guishaninsula JLT2003 TaxID=1231392 RepID=K2H827_9RHOB|nr:flagellar biosynthesis repressor FlbT [Oceaniovalibus guishaninsula]EKE43783.1 FlbT [Oceaniovalibus guishaninsula JLT2003]